MTTVKINIKYNSKYFKYQFFIFIDKFKKK